jgi:excisionase family DNA binding protein
MSRLDRHNALSPELPQQHLPGDDSLLRPREVAAVLGVRPSTIARWAREGKLAPLLTPGGHRRYLSAEIREVLGSAELSAEESTEEQLIAEDAARLYEQGWNIRQVAARFDCSYGVMRRILKNRIALRSRSGRPSRPPASIGQP